MSQGFGERFDQCQRAYDAQEAPEEHDCKEDGHDLKFSQAREIKGEFIVEVKCRHCGKRELL